MLVVAKALPILGIVGAVFGALAIAVLVPDSLAMFLPLLVGLVGSVILVGQRTIPGAIAGIVLLGLTIVAALGLIGTVSTEGGGGADLGISTTVGQVLAITLCLALPVAAVGLRWGDGEPRWLVLAGAACAPLALLLVLLDPQGIAQQNQPDTLVAAVLALLPVAAMVPLLRTDSETVLAPEPAPATRAPSSGAGKGPSPPARRP